MVDVGPHYQKASSNESYTESVVSGAVGEYLTEGSLLHFTPPEYACPTGTSGQDKLGYMQKCPGVGPAHTAAESEIVLFGPVLAGERSQASASVVDTTALNISGGAAALGSAGSQLSISGWK